MTESTQVHLLTSDNVEGKNAREFVYDLNIKGSALHELVASNLQLSTSHTALLIEKRPGVYAWIKNTQSLSHYHPKDGAHLYLLKTMVPLTVSNVADQNKKMFIDITKTVKELVDIIAEKLHIGIYVGYSLFWIDSDKVQHPYDSELSMPEQTLSFEPILFKRRFFCFTRTQLKDRVSAILAFNDAKYFVINSGNQLPATVLPQLVRFSIYANANSPDEISPDFIPNSFQNILPNGITIPEDFRKKFQDFMKTPAPETREAAIERYLVIAHTIPHFGCEVFKCQYSYEKNNQIQSTVYIGPQNISIYNEDQLLLQIPWFRISSVKIHKEKTTIKYMSKDGSDVEIELQTTNRATELYSLVAGYMSITKSLGAEMMTNGFFAVSSSDASLINISPQQFKPLYFQDPNEKYYFYPGTVINFETFFGAHFREFEKAFPQAHSIIT